MKTVSNYVSSIFTFTCYMGENDKYVLSRLCEVKIGDTGAGAADDTWIQNLNVAKIV